MVEVRIQLDLEASCGFGLFSTVWIKKQSSMFSSTVKNLCQGIEKVSRLGLTQARAGG